MDFRWAAKEAAIKAHRHRKLYYRDVSILPNVRARNVASKEDTGIGQKPILLIEPLPQYVIMGTAVARIRGLGGFIRDRLVNDKVLGRIETISGEIISGKFVPGQGPNAETFFLRKRLVQENDRQVAELSISHDGPYVVAVCMALSEKVNRPAEMDYIIDDGSGFPIHEPDWGDKGWLHEPCRIWRLGLDRNGQHLESPLGQMVDTLGI